MNNYGRAATAITTFTTVFEPVSYTHLDVYKRQALTGQH